MHCVVVVLLSSEGLVVCRAKVKVVDDDGLTTTEATPGDRLTVSDN